MSFHLLVRSSVRAMRLKFHGAQICFDTCGIPTSLFSEPISNLA
jgi:hypothetical protein